jgi:hypothetical protein
MILKIFWPQKLAKNWQKMAFCTQNKAKLPI